MADLTPRALRVLYGAVIEYIATGSPVGSRTLSKKTDLDLSAASIRNVLSDLEDLGFLRQPHTSAGRIPTDRAFRLFIDALMKVKELSAEDYAQIQGRFRELGPGQSVMRMTGKLLSELTGTAAVVVSTRADARSLKHLRFVRTMDSQLLAVLVLSDGTVQNRFVRSTLSEAELERVHNLLDDVIDGRSLGDLRELFARRLASDPVKHDSLRKSAFELGEAALSGAPVELADVVIEGQAKLLGKPEFGDLRGIKQVASLLDEREELVRLLDATIEAHGVTVVVGSEAGHLGGGQLSIVGATYTDHGRSVGTVGIIGPTRMDYPAVVPLVTATAQAMSAFMDRHDPEED